MSYSNTVTQLSNRGSSMSNRVLSMRSGTPVRGSWEENEECSICLMEYTKDDPAWVLHKGRGGVDHKFHKKCIDAAMKRNCVCPLCRDDTELQHSCQSCVCCKIKFGKFEEELRKPKEERRFKLTCGHAAHAHCLHNTPGWMEVKDSDLKVGLKCPVCLVKTECKLNPMWSEFINTQLMKDLCDIYIYEGRDYFNYVNGSVDARVNNREYKVGCLPENPIRCLYNASDSMNKNIGFWKQFCNGLLCTRVPLDMVTNAVEIIGSFLSVGERRKRQRERMERQRQRQRQMGYGKRAHTKGTWQLTSKKAIVDGKERALYRNSVTGELRVRWIVTRNGQRQAVYRASLPLSSG